MSLKTRLRLSIVALVVGVVLALSVLNLRSIADVKFADLLERSTFVTQQVQSTLLRRLSEQMSAYPATSSLEETKAVWTNIVRQDRDMASFLRDTLASSRTEIEIQITGEDGVILASSDPTRIGRKAEPLPAFADWKEFSYWRQLTGTFSDRSNYEVTSALGVAGQSQPVFRIRVLISALLLRNTLEPQLWNIALAFMISLAGALALAILASNIAFRPLARVSDAIDRIARGEPPGGETPVSKTGDKEVAAIESKLQVLGQQFRGARADAVDLRSNIQQLMGRMEEAVLLFDRDDKLVMAGRAAEKVFGRGRWDLMGQTVDDLFPASTPHGAVVRGAIEFRKSLKDSRVEVQREGEPAARYLMDIEPMESFPDHDRVGTLITLRDAESRQEIGTRLDLSARLAAISRLTAGVAHEIKNPLNSIALHVEVLRARLDDADPEAERELAVISNEISRLDRVVKAFLDFNRPVDMKFSEVDAGDLVAEITALTGPEAARRGIEIELRQSSGPLMLRADRDLLKQAILNVVVNGVDAMNAGGRLLIEVKRAGAECVIGITDQGPGIPAQVRDKIFNLYFTTKQHGSGIGLAMTFRAVQLHNGTIDFTSEEGRGTSFWLRFPLLDEGKPVVQ
jgi:signal transduction histidine kinase